MMKIFAVLVLVVLGLGGWYFYQNGTKSGTVDVENFNDVVPDVQMETGDEVMEDTSMEQPDETASDVKTFNLTGKNFEFSQTEIRVNEGDTVVINFESTAGLHDWTVDEFEAQTQQVEPGTKTSVTFVADQAGEFEYYCSVGQHRAAGMVGTLIVE